MIVGSTKENSKEKRISITPETSKNIINLGLNVSLIEKVIKKKMPNLNKVINNLCREYKNEF